MTKDNNHDKIKTYYNVFGQEVEDKRVIPEPDIYPQTRWQKVKRKLQNTIIVILMILFVACVIYDFLDVRGFQYVTDKFIEIL